MKAVRKETIDRNLPTIALVLALVVAAICVGMLYLWIFVAPNHPSRPDSVPKQATLVLMGWSHFWQECWFDSKLHQDWCRIYGGRGDVLNDGVFLPVSGESYIPESDLKIASGGNSYSVHLSNGKILIPQKNFDAIKKQLRGDFSDAK